MPDAAGLELGLSTNVSRVASAILFLQASTNAMDVFSALNSSPWTSESFGGDPAKAASCRSYVKQSIGITAFYCFGSAALAQNWWPIIGWALASAFMYWTYERALKRAEASGSQQWADQGA